VTRADAPARTPRTPRRLLELYDKAPREFKDCIECLDYYT
jgi:hypothetical protein